MISNRVVVVDHGLCNLNSICRALEECGGSVTATDDPTQLAHADRIVLPGVGAFPTAMSNLRSKGLDDAIRENVGQRGVPVLGICLGMQLLAERSAEGGDTPGLGLLQGSVVKLKGAVGERIPHMGWNAVDPTPLTGLFEGIPPHTDFYFVHSYHLLCPDAAVAARTGYCGGFVSAVAQGSVVAVQFHPEKSQRAGFRLLQNFLAI